MSKVAFVFPGQGAQYVGMGRDFIHNFPAARKLFEEANDELNMDMQKLCLEGPDEELIKTENTQPAILTTSTAILRALEGEGIDCDYTAGLSLGEYTALVKADTFDFKDAVKLVKSRGRYMQEAVPAGVGTMAAVLGISNEDLNTCLNEAKKLGVVEIANYNSPGQIVISGEVKAVEAAVAEALKMGAKKAVMLPVSAPFHCSLLSIAGNKLKSDLEKVTINHPGKPVIANADAKLLGSRDEVIPSLVKQVSSSVLWVESVELMIKDGVDIFVEIGPGKALTGFVRRIAKSLSKEIKALNVEDMLSFKNAIAELS